MKDCSKLIYITRFLGILREKFSFVELLSARHHFTKSSGNKLTHYDPRVQIYLYVSVSFVQLFPRVLCFTGTKSVTAKR